MKLTPQPHPLSAQGRFEAVCLECGVKLGVLAIASQDAYANPSIQAAWLLWSDHADFGQAIDAAMAAKEGE